MGAIQPSDRERMEQIVEGLPSKSEKIRQLAAAGFKKADIARFLGIRYQFVYNVLSAPAPKTRRTSEAASGFDHRPLDGGSPGEPSRGEPSRWTWTQVEKGRRISLPAAFCDALGIGEGDDVQLHLEDDRVEILTRGTALRSLQEEVRRYVPEGRSLVDELIAERREEAKKEAEGE